MVCVTYFSTLQEKEESAFNLIDNLTRRKGIGIVYFCCEKFPSCSHNYLFVSLKLLFLLFAFLLISLILVETWPDVGNLAESYIVNIQSFES